MSGTYVFVLGGKGKSGLSLMVSGMIFLLRKFWRH
jgi:hypothetical protein